METCNDKIVLIILVAWNKKASSEIQFDCFKSQAERIWLHDSLIMGIILEFSVNGSEIQWTQVIW